MSRGAWLIIGASLCAFGASDVHGANENDGVPLPSALSASHLRSLAATCAACHGTDGHAVKGSKVPGIAGLSQDYFARQMRAYVEGSIPSTVMHQIASGYDERETAALAAYFAAQR